MSPKSPFSNKPKKYLLMYLFLLFTASLAWIPWCVSSATQWGRCWEYRRVRGSLGQGGDNKQTVPVKDKREGSTGEQEKLSDTTRIQHSWKERRRKQKWTKKASECCKPENVSGNLMWSSSAKMAHWRSPTLGSNEQTGCRGLHGKTGQIKHLIWFLKCCSWRWSLSAFFAIERQVLSWKEMHGIQLHDNHTWSH